MNTAVRLSVQHLRKHHGARLAVADVSLTVGPGEIVGLLGPNGAGKSTTIACLLGLCRPDQGSISVDGVDALRQRAQVAQGLGVQLQATALNDALTVHEAVALFRSFYTQGSAPAAILAETELTALAGRRCAALSHGERQRLALALALVNDPRLLVLDEPTAGLDPHARVLMHSIIRRRASAGTGVLLATQLIDEAERLCQRVLILDHGQVIAEGPPARLITDSALPSRVEVRAQRPWDATPWQGQMSGDGRDATFTTARATQLLAAVLTALAAADNEVLACDIRAPTLEDVFLALTGRRIHP